MDASLFELSSLQHLLKDLLARELRVDPQGLDADRPFTQYGLDSIAALGIVGELEDRLSVELNATLLWDCPTINALAAHLRTLSPQGAMVMLAA